MQPVTIEARPAVAIDGGRSITAAASGSASFAALLLETGPGSRAPATLARAGGKGEVAAPKGEPQPSVAKARPKSEPTTRSEDQSLETGTSEAPAGEAGQDGEPVVAAVLPPAPQSEAAQATTVAGDSAIPAPAAATAEAAEMALAGDAAGIEGELQANASGQAAAVQPAEDAIDPAGFEDVLAGAQSASGEQKARPTTPDPKPRAALAAHAGQPQGPADGAQTATAAAQTSQPQTQAAVEAAAQSHSSDASASAAPGAATGADTTSITWTRSDGSGATAGLSPTASAPAQSTDPAAAAPRAPLPPPMVHNQLAVHIQRAVSQGTDRITIHLSPAELGRIDVRLEMVEHGRVSASVVVDRQETLELLQRDARGLERALQDAGLKADSSGLSFTLRDDGRREAGARQPFEHSGRVMRESHAQAVEPAVAAHTAAGTGAIDIRV